jgi:uncharacterized integral membrane protein (TIGR00697 family)
MEQNNTSNKLDLLVGFYVFSIIVAELLGGKTFPIVNVFGYQLNGAIGMFLIPFVYSINDIVFEVYGIKKAKNLAKLSLLVISALIIFAAFAVVLPPSTRFASQEKAYEQIFSQSIRISLASLTALIVSNLADIYVFAKIKKNLSKYGLWLRNNLSNTLALLLDTVLFMTLAFYSLDQSIGANTQFLFGVIVPYWLLKTFMSVITTPVVYAGVKWLKKN